MCASVQIKRFKSRRELEGTKNFWETLNNSGSNITLRSVLHDPIRVARVLDAVKFTRSGKGS